MSLTYVTIATEGDVDAQVCQRVLELVGLGTGPAYVRFGKGNIDKKLRAYNNAARFGPWLVLRDLDHDAECAAGLVQTLLPNPAEFMKLRVAVRSVEAWLMADRERISKYLSVSQDIVPPDPDSEDHPKSTLVNLARRSTKRGIREDMVPGVGHSRAVGPGYTARVTEFATLYWRPEIAARTSDSLARCVRALKEWV